MLLVTCDGENVTFASPGILQPVLLTPEKTHSGLALPEEEEAVVQSSTPARESQEDRQRRRIDGVDRRRAGLVVDQSGREDGNSGSLLVRQSDNSMIDIGLI